MRFMYASTTIHAHPPYEKHDLPYRNSIIIVVIYLFAYHPLSSSPHGFSTVTSNPQIFPLTNRMMCPTITLSLSSPWSLETPSITTRCLCFGRRRSARMSFVHNVIKRTTWLSVGLCVCETSSDEWNPLTCAIQCSEGAHWWSHLHYQLLIGTWLGIRILGGGLSLTFNAFKKRLSFLFFRSFTIFYLCNRLHIY